MIQAGRGGYAQAGNMYRWGYGTCVKRWSEQKPPNAAFQDYYIGGCTTPNTSNRFWNQSIYINSAWYMRSNIDTTVIRQSTFSPFAWGSPYHVTFFSETIFAPSTVPGTSDNPEDWTAMQVQNQADDQWYTTCNNAKMGAHNQFPTAWGLFAQNCDHIQSWTK